MRLLLDANVSPRVAPLLWSAGFEAVHVADANLLTASDEAVLDFARTEHMVVITADADFAMLLAARRASQPSVVHLRSVNGLGAETVAELLIANLAALAGDLEGGAVVSMSPSRLSVRSLPLR